MYLGVVGLPFTQVFLFGLMSALTILNYLHAFVAFDYVLITFGPRREKTCLRGFANNTGADQPAHPRSLISAFVIHF